MSRLFMSFLGTGPYSPCNYTFEGKTVNHVNFVQEAIVKIFCFNWSSKDRIRIFCTEESEKENWLSPAKAGGDGLHDRLAKLKLKPSIENIKIPSGRQEQEILQIFNTAYDTTQNNDEVIIDITHSFRSIPFIVSAVINYAQTLKKIKIGGIYYGAYEAKDPETGNAPILDLTKYSDIINWTWSTKEFVETGETSSLKSLVINITKSSRGSSKAKDERVKGLDDFVNALDKTNRAIKLNRGSVVIDDLDNMKKHINNIKPYIDQYPLLEKLLDEIDEKTKMFKKGDEFNSVEAARWCAKHHLIPQYITFLQESVITHLCNYLGKDYSNIKEREPISKAVVIRFRKLAKEKWDEKAKENSDSVERIYEVIDDETAKYLNKLWWIRNDINHCGTLKNAKNIERLEADALELMKPIERFLRSIEGGRK